jgi:hypothetical protein
MTTEQTETTEINIKHLESNCAYATVSVMHFQILIGLAWPSGSLNTAGHAKVTFPVFLF